MYRFGLTGKFLFTLSVGAFALGVTALLFIFAVNDISDDNEKLFQVDTAGKIATLEISRDINYISRLTRDSMLGGDLQKNLTKLQELARENRARFDRLEQTPFDNNTLGVIRKARDSATKFIGSGEDIIRKLEQTPINERHNIYKIYEKEATPFANAFRADFSTLDKLMSERYLAIQKHTSQKLKMHKRIAIITFLFSTFLIYAVGYFITRSDLKAMRACIAFSAKLGSDGLVERLDPDSSASMYPLVLSLNEAADNIEKNKKMASEATALAVKESEEAKRFLAQAEEAKKAAERAKAEGMQTAAVHLDQIVSDIGELSEALVSQIFRSEAGTKRQTELVAETATAMEEMNSSVLEIAHNSEDASTVAANAREKALSGANTVANVSALMVRLQEQSLNLKKDMDILNSHTTAINQIMGVISDIADQTNLLALNAAIEAARAGEAGRGFAVVADEVRKLAEKTMHSTADVAKAIKSIQESTSHSISRVEQTTVTINDVSKSVEDSGVALSEIVKLIDNTADQSRAIATASEQQSTTSEAINRSVSDINMTAMDTADAMYEVRHAVEGLSKQINKLEDLIGEFKKG
ncbi:methyl-accepting chemotaxis protein [Desulfovibrio litoralis]|uniref:Methyl-accepting chemotaxis protein (MCP) signalling domain-containing protein n=1 Tax=Desulfovibrio litoralis DSM 11393 TaxID=1121455 RepID=A0A1M7T350_9BACT|nr:methyl-accepting chemotaxis protein [Desulfovibrio litoralis]SHN65129.1 Methyl-accepting chemotaxis protein (MCP) signalling domain-containing protein [Desulfovibrio litoralis DSM 11393]